MAASTGQFSCQAQIKVPITGVPKLFMEIRNSATCGKYGGFNFKVSIFCHSKCLRKFLIFLILGKGNFQKSICNSLWNHLGSIWSIFQPIWAKAVLFETICVKFEKSHFSIFGQLVVKAGQNCTISWPKISILYIE